MKYLATLLLALLPSLTLAQSAIPAAVQEYLNPAPRMTRGDSQRYKLEIDYLMLDSLGGSLVLVRNDAYYTQICLENSPDKVNYEVVVDSFGTGAPVSRTGEVKGKQRMKDFEGYSFQYTLGKTIPLTGDCYDPSDILDQDHYYVQAQEFMDQFTLIRLLEQFRFMAGRSLAYIGDTAVFKLPGELCYKIPGLVTSCRVNQQPYTVKVLGISRYLNEPCVLLEISARPSPLLIEFLDLDGNQIEAKGNRMLNGRFMISLRNGTLVSTDLQERLTGIMSDGKNSEQNDRVISTRLRAIY
ncbi:MAG: hypothetical protein ABIJ61_05790 [bacterium]